MLTLVAGTFGLAHHHIGLGATAGTNLQATPGTRRRSGDELGVKVRGNGSGAIKHAGRNRNLSIHDRRMATREYGCHKLRNVRIRLGRKGVLMQSERRRSQKLPAKLSAPSGVSDDAIMRAQSQRGRPIKRDRRTRRRSDSSASAAAASPRRCPRPYAARRSPIQQPI